MISAAYRDFDTGSTHVELCFVHDEAVSTGEPVEWIVRNANKRIPIVMKPRNASPVRMNSARRQSTPRGAMRRVEVGVLMRRQRAGEGVAVELVMALDADLQRAVAQGTGNAQYDVAVVELAVVQRALRLLIDPAADQLGRAGDAAAILAPVGQIHALLAQALQERPAAIDRESDLALAGG